MYGTVQKPLIRTHYAQSTPPPAMKTFIYLLTLKAIIQCKGAAQQAEIAHSSSSDEQMVSRQRSGLVAFVFLQEMMRDVESMYTPYNEMMDFIFADLCPERELCDRFNHETSGHLSLSCDESGHLSVLNLSSCQLVGSIRWSMIPDTVTRIHLRRNKLSGHFDVWDLQGKSLTVLSIEQASDMNNLKIDLSGLVQSVGDPPLALKTLSVSKHQIDDPLGLHGVKKSDVASIISKWTQSSTLDKLVVRMSWKVHIPRRARGAKVPQFENPFGFADKERTKKGEFGWHTISNNFYRDGTWELNW